MACITKFRNELKYLINETDMVTLRNRIKHIMRVDRNAGADGNYFISSIYFDDARNTALYEKLNGVNERSKFRIRIYNYDNSYIVLEKKSKYNNLTQKASIKLSAEQFENMIAGKFDFLSDSKAPLLREFLNKVSLDRLRPCQLVEYKREPYIYQAGNVRITFDMNLRTAPNVNYSIFNQLKPTFPVLEKGMHILEIKYDEFLPEHIRNILQLNSRQIQACSKYVLCRLSAANYN